MDHRIALKQNTTLCLRNDRGEAIHCVIESEIGRGGSCIVYEASRVTNTGDKTLYRVKEFYPYRLNISRNGNNCLTPSAEDAEAFNQGREQFRSDFSRTSQLFYSDTNYSSMTNQLDVFRQNGTYYILSAYSSNQTLATYKPETLKECVMLVKQVAHVLGNIHKQGYLYLDTKPQNVLVVDGYQKQVQLFDFDSLLSVHELKKPSELGCSDIRLSYSKGFAPIELRTLKIKRLGPHTDVYGVGALLFYLLFGYTPTAPDCEMDSEFDFSKIQYDFQKCDDRLFCSLRDFFHHVRLQYNLVCAWYFALERDDTASTDVFVKEACELSDIIIPTDLQKIEEVIIPCANIYFELNCYDKAMALLYEGTRICTKHANMDSYAHIRQELCDHLWEVGIKAHQFEWCQKTIERIEAENEEIVDLKNRVVIPDEVRNIITNR